MNRELPQAVKICLWSYDTDKFSFSNPDDRFRIIFNVLNYGTKEAVEWLWRNFSEKEIAETIHNSIESEWDRKSLNFWSLVYQVSPARKSRFVKSHGNSSFLFLSILHSTNLGEVIHLLKKMIAKV